MSAVTDASVATAESVQTWPPKDAWDRWYGSIPDDIKRKLSFHDLKRLGDCFEAAFQINP